MSKTAREKGTGTVLLKAMEEFFKSEGCVDILLAVLSYNENAIKFYERHGYHSRTMDMTKTNI